jgi:glycosyltransferase involved in cell wall biosynthesis
MQKLHESIIRLINQKNKHYNVLTFPTHESTQQNLSASPHSFYLFQGKGIKTWNNRYRQLPKNHILLDGSEDQVKSDMKFDLVISQNRFAHFQIAKQISDQLQIPLISLEHTLCYPTWSEKFRKMASSMRGDLNVFITEYSMKEWGYSLSDRSVDILPHGIDTDSFKPLEDGHNDGKILTVANDYINRDMLLGFSIFKETCIDTNLPINPVGDTPNLSVSANGEVDLISKYQNASVFFNTSLVSPIPHSLLEAASCGCPIVSTNTCEIPNVFTNGEDAFLSNDKQFLKEKLIWLLGHPVAAKKMGEKARETILNKFNLKQHLDKWNDIIQKAINIKYAN